MPRVAAVGVAYVPFKTFLRALDTLRQGVPKRVDASVFRDQSFSTQAMIVSSLRAIDAIDVEGRPRPLLRRLVNPPRREAALKDVLEKKYKGALELGPAASEKQLDECFARYGVNGDTRKKAKSFFLQAAAMVGIRPSPHIRGAAPRKRRGASPKPDVGRIANGSSKTVRLATGGGEVTLTVSIDPMELGGPDRAFVFELIDRLKAYEKRRA